jgi:hypothetical protein
MARKFLTPLALPTLTEPPGSAFLGTIYFDVNTNLIKVYNGTGWIAVGGVSADDAILDHTHNYDGGIDFVSYGTLVDSSKFLADGGGASTTFFNVTFDGGDASDS